MKQIKSPLQLYWQRLESDCGKIKYWWKQSPLIHSIITVAYGLGLFFLIVNLLICGGILKGILNSCTKKETVEFVAYIISTCLTPIIMVASFRLYLHRQELQWKDKFKSWWKKNRTINSLITGICVVGLCLVIVMLLTCEGGIFAGLLGTSTKKETIEFIAFGIGGLLAVMGAIAINHRAEAQHRIADAQVENNKLVEKGHIDERFKSATEKLESENPIARIFAFRQFYYWAKGQKDTEFKKSIFEILCAHLRNMTQKESYQEEIGKDTPTEECQTLLDVLFESDDKSVFLEFQADMQKSYLVRADLSDANLSNANLSDSYLSRARLGNANLSGASLSHTDFSHAILIRANLSRANLLFANLSHAHLFRANFSNAYLFHANFSHTNLFCANLSDAYLFHANLSDANLSGANFSNANLSNVNLSDADLSGANLSSSNLSSADLSGTDLQGTQLKNVNLMEVSSIKKADFREAKIGDIPITKNDLPSDKGEYYAEWNPPPEKEEN